MKVFINTDQKNFEKMSQHFSNLSLDRGFVISDGVDFSIHSLEEHTSLSLKIVDKLRNLLFKKQHHQPQPLFANPSLDSIDFLSHLQPFIFYIHQITSRFDNLVVQIQPHNEFNENYFQNYLLKAKIKNKAASLLKGDFSKKEIPTVSAQDAYILNSLNPQKASIQTQAKIMNLGTNSLSIMLQKYSDQLNAHEILGFIYFHELGHQLSYESANNYSMIPSQKEKKHSLFDSISEPIYQDFIQKEHFLLNQDFLDEYNYLLSESCLKKDFTPIDNNFFLPLIELKEEYYADISSCLLMYNFLVFEKKDTIPNIQQFLKNKIKALITFREDSCVESYQNLCNQFPNKEKNLFFSVDHLTTQALSKMIDLIDVLPQRELNMDEMINISRAYSNQSYLEIVYAFSQISPSFQQNLKTLLELDFNFYEKTIKKNPHQSLDDFLDCLEQQSDPKWLSSFHKILEKNKDADLDYFELLKSTFYSHIQENISSSHSQKNTSLSFAIPNMNDVMIRKEKISQSSLNSHQPSMDLQKNTPSPKIS